MKALIIIVAALIVFGGLIVLKVHLADQAKKGAATGKIADIPSLENRIKADSLYSVKEILYKDSGILIALDNPGKSGAENYFDKKFKLNDYANINMVYIFLYDSSKPLQKVLLDDAIMAKGKKMGRFQEIWVSKYVDTADGSCTPLKRYLQSTIKNRGFLQTEETSFQPESIFKMRVECKYRVTDSLGNKTLNEITVLVDTSGTVTPVDKPQ